MARTGTRTSTVVKSRYIRPGSGRTTPRSFRGRAGSGARRQIGVALRYIETRPLGPHECAGDRSLFSAAADTVSRQGAREDLAHWVMPGVAYHSMVLSPGPLGEGMTAEQMCDWTRQVMADLEKRLGGSVSWYAAVHQHTNHIHVHVIVAASRVGADGARQATWFKREDFAAMRGSGDRWAEHEQQTARLLWEAERYAAEILHTMLTLPHGGGSSRGASTDRDDIERSLGPRR